MRVTYGVSTKIKKPTCCSTTSAILLLHKSSKCKIELINKTTDKIIQVLIQLILISTWLLEEIFSIFVMIILSVF